MNRSARSPLGEVSDIDFARLFEELGPKALATLYGVSKQSVQDRRHRYETSTGKVLKAPYSNRGKPEQPVTETSDFRRVDPSPAHRNVEELVAYRIEQTDRKACTSRSGG